MSLPNYLAKIKSAGMYRFTFDKSQVPAANAATMRLVVGYSEKGPFNNPVYIDNKADFISLFGNINKRLEKKGVFFHRMALQALSAGPIFALNLKPFGEFEDDNTSTEESVKIISFDPYDSNATAYATKDLHVTNLYDTNRFWKIDESQLVERIETHVADYKDGAKYINISAIDTKEQSCSIFVRRCPESAVKQYNVSLVDWYKNLGEDFPEYLEPIKNDMASKYFMEVYVFRGEFTEDLMTGNLSKYFSNSKLNEDYYNQYTQSVDALSDLAADENSKLVGIYRGSVLPNFKDQFNNYVSLDNIFNADTNSHRMIMQFNDNNIESVIDTNGSKLVGSTSAYVPTYIEGYTYNTIGKATAANAIHVKCLNMLTNPGVYNALTNHVDSEYHYIIDTFASYTGSEYTAAKYNIAAIAKAKDNCLAIMNYPARAEFNKITNFKLEEIGQHFGMPGESAGASYCAFYTPLMFMDGNSKITVPSAAIVSNNFMEKWNSRQPYYIVAGPNYGAMSYDSLIGPDYNYSRDDLNVYEPLGVNCMVYVPRIGTYINSNQTAKQTPVSALSKVHVRELVIYLQNEIEYMMQNYQWELNTQTLRDIIKTKADAILDRIKANGGVYDYINVCDGSNNTPEVIDNEMIILDTSIEPARGAGKMVQRLTIHKTGGISSLTK